MASKVTNAATEACLRDLLGREGYSLNDPRGIGELGVDIVATNGSEEIHIEVIGYKSSGPARAKDFYEAFFRAVSRIKDGATRYVIAMPHLARRGLPQRARQYGVAWSMIGETFTGLEIWLVDVEDKVLDRSRWNDWLHS